MYGEVGSAYIIMCVGAWVWGGVYACLYMHIYVDQVAQTVFHVEHSVTLHCV